MKRRFYQDRIELVVIGIDPPWQNGFSDFSWNKENFPEPDLLVDF